MEERLEVLYDKILAGLERAGRNRRKINRVLEHVESELKKSAGPKATAWTEEYYQYLMDGLRNAMTRAIGTAVEREEYEWAAALQFRVESMELELKSAKDPLENVKL